MSSAFTSKAPSACCLWRGFPPRALCHLKDSYQYLDFPLRGISRGHRGAEQPQRRERRSCSVADRRSVWWFQTSMTHPAFTAGIPSLAQGNTNRFSHLVDKLVLSVLCGVCNATSMMLLLNVYNAGKQTPHSLIYSFILLYPPPPSATSSAPFCHELVLLKKCFLATVAYWGTDYGFL